MFKELALQKIARLLARGKRLLLLFPRKRAGFVQLNRLRVGLLEESTLDPTYLVLVVGSCIIATLGLLANSAAVIIGAMIVAPLMSPIRGLAFGALEGNVILFRRGLISLAVGTLLAVAIAGLVGYMAGIPVFESEILSRTKPNLLDLGIAIAAGSISGYAKVQPKISGSLAGTAIAVALMPPICVIGLGLARASWSLSLGALLLYLTNLLGITLSCMVAFLFTGYIPLAQARRALLTAAILTGILLIPLGLSFIDLVRQARLENNLRQALLNRTLTFQRVELVKIQTNWLVNPPQVRLTVLSQEAITPKQVELLQSFVGRAMGQPFTLIFEVSQLSEVRSEGISVPSQKVNAP